jgi:hypothetical protein
MKLNATQTIAAAVAGTLALTGLGAAAFSASVHEQNCLSYERQVQGDFETMENLVTKADGMIALIDENPFAALALIGEVTSLRTSVEATSQRLNDTRYAYTGTCGLDRYHSFIERPEVKAQVEAVSAGLAKF